MKKTFFTTTFFAVISIFLTACASEEKPIPEYNLIPKQTKLRVNPTLYNNTDNVNNNTNNIINADTNNDAITDSNKNSN